MTKSKWLGEVMRQVFLEGRPLHIFPCRFDKKPCTRHGFYDAVSGLPSIIKLWTRACGPRIGVATGAVSGIDVIDIDPRNSGHEWLEANRDRLPITRMHKTPGGFHLIYRHCPGLQNVKIAPGVDLKTTGGYVIWWPAHDYPVLVFGPVAQFPTWVAAGEMGVIANASATSKSGNGSEVTPISFLEVPLTDYEINYAKRALGNAFLELRECPPGCRNAKLNALAYKMGRLIARGWITRERVEALLLKGAEQCGLLTDDGERQCQATIASGVRAGMIQPYHDIGQRVAS